MSHCNGNSISLSFFYRRQTTEEREAERNAATKYIIKMQQSAAVVHAASAAAAIWPSLMTAHVPPVVSLSSSVTLWTSADLHD